MRIEVDLLTVDFNKNTLTFEVPEDFWGKVSVKGSPDKSIIECPNLEFKQ